MKEKDILNQGMIGPASDYKAWADLNTTNDISETLDITEKEKTIKNYISEWMFKSVPSNFKDQYKDIFNRQNALFEKKSDAKISIVIPAYKEENFIRSTLDSLVNQKWWTNKNDFEVILVVNHPTGSIPEIIDYEGWQKNCKPIGKHQDKTADIAKEYKDKLNLHIIEQDFPKNVSFESSDVDILDKIDKVDWVEKVKIAWIGIVRKLWLDMALSKWFEYLAYADADIFGPKYVKAIKDRMIDWWRVCLKDFKTHKIYNKVINSDGTQTVLDENQHKEFWKAHDNYYTFGRKIRNLRNNLPQEKSTKKIKPWWFATTADLYASIGWMKLKKPDYTYAEEIAKATGAEVEMEDKLDDNNEPSDDFSMICRERLEELRIEKGTNSNTEILHEIYKKFKESGGGNFKVMNPVFIEALYLIKKGILNIETAKEKYGLSTEFLEGLKLCKLERYEIEKYVKDNKNINFPDIKVNDAIKYLEKLK